MNALVIPEDLTRWFTVRDGLPYTRLSFAVIAEHRAQIEYNHVATLEALNAAGGLDFFELYCGLTGRGLYPAPAASPRAQRERVIAIISAGPRRPPV